MYVNQFFTDRPGSNGTKHVYAGKTRIASKLMRQDAPNSNPHGNTPFEKDLYFYHPDHLGSSNFVTDLNGKLYEHLEYFPFGESWVEENSNVQRTPYLFTAKELDEETGLYYFGARYYDPRTSVWQSTDPILEKYLTTGNRETDRKLPGRGGVFAPLNLGLYTYSHQNPVLFVDPDGEFVEEVAKTVAKRTALGWAVAVTEPTPVGEVVMAAVTLAATAHAIYQVTKSDDPQFGRVYATYTKTDPETGAVYSGRTSAVVDLRKPILPQAELAVAARDAGHHIEGGFGPARLDKYAVGGQVNYANRYQDNAYIQIRGREQQLIDFHGGAQSDGGTSGNPYRGVSKGSEWGRIMHNASSRAFGEIAPYTGDK